MKRPTITAVDRRKSSTPHYQTFPTKPPTSRGRPPSSSSDPPTYPEDADHPNAGGEFRSSEDQHESPLPKKQLMMLAIIALAEQTALNSISPYLPDMASSFPEVGQGEVGLYVGLIASAFALAQFATNFFWGWLSDRIGRKPVILTGTLLTAACFVAFGFTRTLGQAIAVQALMGIVNGNQGVVSTCLGEITDRSNQSRAFTYLPVVYGMGGITGPIVGGLLVYKQNPFNKSKPNPYPYLLPNVLAAGVLLIDFVLTIIFLEESLEEARKLPPFGKRMESLFVRLWEFTTSTRPSYLRFGSSKKHQKYRASDGSEAAEEESEDTSASDSVSETESMALLPIPAAKLTKKEVLNRNTMLLLGTYLIFQLSNISYNSLYPIFAQGAPPTGRNLNPDEIGVSLAFAGIITIVFQVGIFGKLREKMGNKTTYRVGLAGFVVAFVLMPWVGYKDTAGPGFGQGKVWLWIEIGFVLLIKTVAAVGGLTSALLLITNSAPNHSVLGTLNGLAQTLSAAGRAVGPFVSGGLFSLATHVRPKGEALAWGLFGGIALVGFFLSFGIRGNGLEAQGWDEEGQMSEDDEDDEDNDDDDHDEPRN